MARIFISHAADDESLVEEFVDLLQVGVGVHPDDIFCSSLPGMGIPTGMDFIKYIKSKIQNPDFVILIVTKEFLQSEFCHNEVGASWALSLPIRPLLVPPLKFNNVRGVLAGTQIAMLNDKEILSDLRDEITEKLNLTPFRTSHWERKRDKFLAKLEELLPRQTATNETITTQQPTITPASAITTSGAWLKLGDRFYKSERFERHGKNNILLQISSSSAEDDAALNRLRPHQEGRGDTTGFAYQNEGGFARIDKVSSASQAEKNVWSIEMTFVDDQRGGMWNDMSYSCDNKHYSPDDIAELRAGRLLINDPPPPRRKSRGIDYDYLESIISGSSDSPVKTDKCIVRTIVAQNRDNLETALSWARLEAVFRLKATKVIESILEFSLGPLVGEKLHIRFRGQRPIRYQNEPPETITVEGDCELS